MRFRNARELERSPVVANCSMNRERGFTGSNSYQRELKLDLLHVLHRQLRDGPVKWTDLCCGRGKALIEAASEFKHAESAHPIQIEGIDLAGMFDPNPFPDILTLREQAVESWSPSGALALVTCVHGFHYVGDKLAVIAKGARSLASGGVMIANLDLSNFRYGDGQPAGRGVVALLRRNGISYDARRRLVRCDGPREIKYDLRYLGADDKAGKNYTGQPAVDSYYDAQ
jgi:methyltransferase family protein